MRIVHQRIWLDMEGQVSIYQNVYAEISSAFTKLDQHVMLTSNLTDLVRGALDIIVELSGYLLWDMQLTAISEQPELVADFTGTKAIVDEFITANSLQGS